MAFSASTIEVPLAMQRAREQQNQRYEAYLQYGLDDTQINDQMELEEEEAELDTCWSWCVCIGALLVNCFVVGVHHAFGVIFIAVRNEFDISFETAAWLGSLSYGISSFLSPLSGLVFHRIGHRACATLGTFISVAGLIGCSFARNTVELFLAYVAMFGLGTSLSYTPAVVVCNGYFDRHLGLATGIQMSGTTVGGIILPPLCQVLLTSVGYRAMMRVLAGTACLGFVGASTFTGKQEEVDSPAENDAPQSGVRRYLSNVRMAMRDPPFLLWMVAMIVVHFGSMTPIVHTVSRGLDIGLSGADAAATVSVISVCSALGRIVFGRMLDHPRFSSQRVMCQLSFAIMGLSLMLTPGVVNLPLMLVFALIYGWAEGLYAVLIPLYTLKLVGPQGAAMGWSLIIGSVSIPWIIGPFLAGLLRSMLGSYDLAYVLCGVCMTIAAALLFAMPLCLRKRRLAQPASEEAGERQSTQLTIQGLDIQTPADIGPIFGYISIHDMPPSYRQQIRFRPGKTQQLRQGPLVLAQSTAQTLSNLEIAPAIYRAAAEHHKRHASRSQEVVSHPAPFEYDSLAALRGKLAPAATTALQAAVGGTTAADASPPTATTASASDAVIGGAGGGRAPLGPTPLAPPPPDHLPPGYEALPVAGYLVLAPGSDQARFVVVDSRAGQTLMLRTSLTAGPGDPADERDDELRQMLETIVEESKSNITVVDTGEVAHERFSQVRRAVTGWKAYPEADETDDASVAEMTRSVEEVIVTPEPDQERGHASRSCDDVTHLAADSPAQAQSVTPSDITLSEVAGSQEWHEPAARPASALSDRARSAEARRRRGRSRSDAGSVSSAEEAGDELAAPEEEPSRPYY